MKVFPNIVLLTAASIPSFNNLFKKIIALFVRRFICYLKAALSKPRQEKKDGEIWDVKHVPILTGKAIEETHPLMFFEQFEQSICWKMEKLSHKK